MNLTEARTRLAAAVSTLDFVNTCTPRPVVNNVRAGDAWVVFRNGEPGAFRGESVVTLEAIVSLGNDQAYADEHVDDVAVGLINVPLEDHELYGRDVSVEPQRMVAPGTAGGTVFAVTLSITLELSA